MVFTAKQLRVSAVSSISLKTKFKGVLLKARLNLCLDGLGLCQSVVIFTYILTRCHISSGKREAMIVVANGNRTKHVATIDVRFGAVGSDVGRINEVTLRRARLVLGWVTVSGFNSRCGKFISV